MTEYTDSSFYKGTAADLKGPVGPQGPQGIRGADGPQGPAGPKGDSVTGPQGPVGPIGPGPTTAQLNAAAAAALIANPPPAGPQGPQGAQGDTGPQGLQGPKGDAGPQGIQGIQGVQGPKGDTGATGPKGDTGAQGPQGNTGPAGPSDAQTLAGQTPGYYTDITGRLGYTPVQQGTGVGQLQNAVKIGWTSSGRLRVAVDATDLGFITTDGALGAGNTTIDGAIMRRKGNDLWGPDNFDPASKQNALGFTPPRQGGGTGMSNNTLYLGWDGFQIRAQVDGFYMGGLAVNTSRQRCFISDGTAAPSGGSDGDLYFQYS